MADDPHLYRVGAPYSPTRSRWPEAGEYNYRSGAHELRLFWHAPRSREVNAIRRGLAEFALYVEGPLIVLLYRFDFGPWSDAPYAWHLVPEGERQAPAEVAPGELLALLHIVLVDAGTGIIRALRALTFSAAFSAALHRAIREQAAQPWDAAAYDAALAALYRRYPTTEALLAAAQLRTESRS